jgi:hypothetical protein
MLEAIFKARSQELIELHKATKGLPGTTVMGILREELVSRILSEFMPKRFGIGTRGIIISAEGSSTKEIDVIIYDKENLTLFKPLALWLGEHVYPSEGVYMAIEVERFLSPEKLGEKLSKLAKAKRLSREACYPSSGAVYTEYYLYGRKWRVPPLLTMIFAYDGVDLKPIVEKLKQHIKGNNLNPWEYPDLISILKKGSIAWSENEDKIALTPTKESKPFALKAEPYQTLAFAYVKITQLIGQLELPPINILKYMKDFHYGTRT